MCWSEIWVASSHCFHASRSASVDSCLITSNLHPKGHGRLGALAKGLATTGRCLRDHCCARRASHAEILNVVSDRKQAGQTAGDCLADQELRGAAFGQTLNVRQTLRLHMHPATRRSGHTAPGTLTMVYIVKPRVTVTRLQANT